MNTDHPQRHGKPRQRSTAGRAVSGALALALALAGTSAAFGAEADATEATTPDDASARSVSVAELERQFWVCDHASTRAAMDFGTAARCSRTTEDLRLRRFGGDFSAMLGWWRERKAAEHAALDAAEAPAASLDGATPEQLKAAYLHCERLATTEHLDSAAAAACSMVYEALKARVFGGSTERVIDWMRQQQAAFARLRALRHGIRAECR